jgi:hypothetical protein
MKNEKKYQTVGTVPKSNRKIGETSKIDAINAQRYERSFFWLGTCASIKSGGVKHLPSNKTVIMQLLQHYTVRTVPKVEKIKKGEKSIPLINQIRPIHGFQFKSDGVELVSCA